MMTLTQVASRIEKPMMMMDTATWMLVPTKRTMTGHVRVKYQGRESPPSTGVVG